VAQPKPSGPYSLGYTAASSPHIGYNPSGVYPVAGQYAGYPAAPAGYGGYGAYSPYSGFGYQPWTYPYMTPIAVPLVPQQESLAIWSLILGIVGLAICQPVGTVAAVLGIISLRRIDASEHSLKGKGMAVAGIIMGVMSTIWMIVVFMIVLSSPEIFTPS
jgi:hypothetical protein